MSKGNPNRPRAKRGRPQDPARAQALLSGAIRYQGAPCKHGHKGERYVSTGACVACYGVSIVADNFAGIWE